MTTKFKEKYKVQVYQILEGEFVQKYAKRVNIPILKWQRGKSV